MAPDIHQRAGNRPVSREIPNRDRLRTPTGDTSCASPDSATVLSTAHRSVPQNFCNSLQQNEPYFSACPASPSLCEQRRSSFFSQPNLATPWGYVSLGLLNNLTWSDTSLSGLQHNGIVSIPPVFLPQTRQVSLATNLPAPSTPL